MYFRNAKGFNSTDVNIFFKHLGILIFCNDCDYAKKNIDLNLYDKMFKELKNQNYDVDALMEEVQLI